VTLPGDRRDDLLAETAEAIAAWFGAVVIYEDGDRRGRQPGEMQRLISAALRRARPDITCQLADGPEQALRAAVALAGGAPTLFLYEKLAEARAALNAIGAVPWSDVTPWPVPAAPLADRAEPPRESDAGPRPEAGGRRDQAAGHQRDQAHPEPGQETEHRRERPARPEPDRRDQPPRPEPDGGASPADITLPDIPITTGLPSGDGVGPAADASADYEPSGGDSAGSGIPRDAAQAPAQAATP
jgi:hypothetical protein